MPAVGFILTQPPLGAVSAGSFSRFAFVQAATGGVSEKTLRTSQVLTLGFEPLCTVSRSGSLAKAHACLVGNSPYLSSETHCPYPVSSLPESCDSLHANLVAESGLTQC